MEKKYTNEDLEKFKETCGLFEKLESNLGELLEVVYLAGENISSVKGHLYAVSRFNEIVIAETDTGRLLHIKFQHIIAMGGFKLAEFGFQPFDYLNYPLAKTLVDLTDKNGHVDVQTLGGKDWNGLAQRLATIERERIGNIVADAKANPKLLLTDGYSRLGRVYCLDWLQAMFPEVEVFPKAEIPFIPEDPDAYKLIYQRR